MKVQKTPLVSVCVQTYNQADYIGECLDGILKQIVNFHYEIILGEDNSTDGTREICMAYQKKHPSIINLILRSRKDVIVIDGEITGRFNFIENLKAAKGKYIAICEGDDYWLDSNKLQRQIEFMESNEDYNICFHDVKVFDQECKIFKEDTITRQVPETTTIKDLVKGNYIHTPSVVLRNNFEVPDWLSKVYVGDWSLYLSQIKDGKIKKIDSEMAVYRVHNRGFWSRKSIDFKKVKIKNTLKVISENNDFPKEIREIIIYKLAGIKKKTSFRYKASSKLKAFLRDITKSLIYFKNL